MACVRLFAVSMLALQIHLPVPTRQSKPRTKDMVCKDLSQNKRAIDLALLDNIIKHPCGPRDQSTECDKFHYNEKDCLKNGCTWVHTTALHENSACE